MGKIITSVLATLMLLAMCGCVVEKKTLKKYYVSKLQLCKNGCKCLFYDNIYLSKNKHTKKAMAYNAKVFKSLTMQHSSNSLIAIKLDSTYGYLVIDTTNKAK